MIRRLLQRLRRDESGFTIVEVMASALVLAVGVYPAIDIVTRGHENSATAQNLEIMSRVGTEAVEEMRSLPWSTLKAGAVSSTTTIPADAEVPDRVDFATGKYQVPGGGPLEPLAVSAGGTLKRYERITVGTGSGARTLDVWRVPSFRTESCAVIDLTQLYNQLTTLRTSIASSLSLLSSLTTAGTGRLARIVTEANSAVSKLTNALFASTVGSLNAAATAATTLRTTLLTIQSSLTALDSSLVTLKNQIDSPSASGLIAGKVLDLCQLPDDTVLPSVDDLTAITSALNTLNSGSTSRGFANLNDIADDLFDEVDEANDIAGLGLLASIINTLLAPVKSAIDALRPQLALTSAVLGTASDGDSILAAGGSGSTQTNLSTLASGQVTKIGSLVTALTTGNPHNTVRVTVAVELVNPPAGTGPKKPAYFTTVVTNPKAGLL